MVRRGVAIAVGALAVAAIAGGCALGRQSAAGHAIDDSPRVLARQPGLGITLSVTGRLVHQGTLPQRPAPPQPLELSGFVDLEHGRAEYHPTSSPRAMVVFDGETVYGLTPNAAPDDARPWVAVVLDKHLSDTRLDPSGTPVTLAAADSLRPALLVDFLDGVLTGSIRRVGTQTIGGVAATEYLVRYDYSQALVNATRVSYSQRAQDDEAKLLKALSISTGHLGHGAVWLDSSGLPRRVEETFVETPAPQAQIDVTFTMTFTPEPSRKVAVPGPDSVVTMPSLFEFLTSVGAPQ